MRLLSALNKPEYWFRPSQFVRKLRFAMRGRRDDDLEPVRLPWGDILFARAGEAIGASLLTLGVHELAVSEVLWRLVDAGDICLDIGANIGYMTNLLGARVGSVGKVYAFEPHPQVFRRLQTNLENSSSNAWVATFEEAIGAADGYANLIEPKGFKQNEGTASLGPSSSPECSDSWHRVKVRRLDHIFTGDEQVALMKIDVEGAELSVLCGAERLIIEKKVRDIVWEDHLAFPSESVQLLSRHGYRIYQFAKRVSGPFIWDPFARSFSSMPWETINYLATVDPSRAERRLRRRGWHCLLG
jgi:FkbM family methyltransferase